MKSIVPSPRESFASVDGIFGQQQGSEPSNLFGPIRDLLNAKQGTEETCDASERRKQDKYSENFVGRVAKAPLFEQLTLGIIVFNAIEIGWDADYSARWHKPDNLFQGPLGFIICEVFFCAYFTLEIVIRFIAHRRKLSCFRDGWFMFDSALVSIMIMETAVLPVVGTSGPLGQLSVLRLLRILRITRMAKLMRAFPQLLMIVRGINAAMRAVSWTAMLLVIVTMTWAVVFTNQFHQGNATDEEVEESGDGILIFFGSMGKSMLSLLVMGTILDDVTACTDAIRATGNNGMLLCFLVYILLNSFTMMNMLLGILVEVVGTTSDAEKKSLMEQAVRDYVMTVFVQMDADGSGRISRDEFLLMKHDPKVMKALEVLDIREKQFDYYVDLLFQPELGSKMQEETTLSFEELFDCILRLRPGSEISSLDFASFRQALFLNRTSMTDRMSRIEGMLSRLTSMPPLGCSEGEDVALSPTPAFHHKITSSMLADLEHTSSANLITELQRRLGFTKFEEAGVPWGMMDEELQNHIKAVANSQMMGAPEPQQNLPNQASEPSSPPS